MKNVFLFVAIITVCGSLMKAPVYRMCETSLVIKYYSNGKLLYTDESKGMSETQVTAATKLANGNVIQADSISYEPKYSTYRMLDK